MITSFKLGVYIITQQTGFIDLKSKKNYALSTPKQINVLFSIENGSYDIKNSKVGFFNIVILFL